MSTENKVLEAENVEVTEKKGISTKVKIVGIVVAVIAVIVAYFILAEDTVEGVWELYSIEQGTSIMIRDEIFDQTGFREIYNFNADGVLLIEKMGDEIQGAWYEEEDVVYISYGSTSKELQLIDKDTMITQNAGSTVTITRL